jgi:hypothetical protein
VRVWGGGGALPQQAINKSEAVQQERWSMRLCVNSGKLILATIYFRRVRIDGRSHAAAPTQVSTVATAPAPAAQKLSVGLQLCGKLALAAIPRAVLRLQKNTSAWASWLPHWPTCMCVISRDDSIGFDSRFCVFFVFLPT